MIAMVENKFTPQPMPDYGVFAATRSVPTPYAYVFRREAALQPVLDNLRNHGVTVEELTEPATLEVNSFIVDDVTHAQRPFQNHNEVSLKGSMKTESIEFPVGSILVRTTQPLSALVFYLLEPESDDGLTDWNFFDAYLTKGSAHPVHKLMKRVTLASRILG